MANIVALLSDALAIAKKLREISGKLKDAETKSLIADLDLALADLKKELTAVQEENARVREQLKQPQDMKRSSKRALPLAASRIPSLSRALYWAHVISDVFIPQISVLRETIDNRLLPTFDGISKEAEGVSEEVWGKLSSSASLDSGPESLAEAAHRAGLDYYLMMADTKQGLINLFAVGIHHLVEQQQLFLLRRELLPFGSEDAYSLLNINEFVTRFTAAGIDPRSLDGWQKLKELRDVANAVKHAESRAVVSLRSRRPDLGVPPDLRDDPLLSRLTGLGQVYQPLSGDDLYVPQSDLDKYCEAAEKFWRAIEAELRRKAC